MSKLKGYKMQPVIRSKNKGRYVITAIGNNNGFLSDYSNQEDSKTI